jgi:hypothetical protein
VPQKNIHRFFQDAYALFKLTKVTWHWSLQNDVTKLKSYIKCLILNLNFEHRQKAKWCWSGAVSECCREVHSCKPSILGLMGTYFSKFFYLIFHFNCCSTTYLCQLKYKCSTIYFNQLYVCCRVMSIQLILTTKSTQGKGFNNTG